MEMGEVCLKRAAEMYIQLSVIISLDITHRFSLLDLYIIAASNAYYNGMGMLNWIWPHHA